MVSDIINGKRFLKVFFQFDSVAFLLRIEWYRLTLSLITDPTCKLMSHQNKFQKGMKNETFQRVLYYEEKHSLKDKMLYDQVYWDRGMECFS